VRAPRIGFAQLVQDFFLRRLVAQRGASARTVESYRDAFVIWSLPEGVVDVRDGAVRCRDLPAGRGYLLRSSTEILGRFDVRSAGGGGRAAA